MPAYFDLRSYCETCGLEYADRDQIKRFNPENVKLGIPEYNPNAQNFNRHLNKICPRCKNATVIELNTVVAGVHMAPKDVMPQEELEAIEEARVKKLKQMGMEDPHNKGIDPETGLEI